MQKIYDPFDGFEHRVLKNGLEIFLKFVDRPWIMSKFIIHSGSNQDPSHIPGVAHFTEHMVSENVPQISNEKITNFFNEKGGNSMLGSTSFLSTQYGFDLIMNGGDLDEALSMYGRMLLHREGFSKHLERERSIIQKEFARRYPLQQVFELEERIRKNLFLGHQLGNSTRPIGNLDSIGKITQADTEEYFQKNYTPQNMTIVVIGGISMSEFVKKLNGTLFLENFDGQATPILTSKFTPTGVLTTEKFDLKNLTSLGVNGSQYSNTWALPTTLDFKTTRVLRSVLSKVLTEKIRTNLGATYSVDFTLEHFQNVAELRIITGTANDKLDTVQQIVREVIQNLNETEEVFHKKLNGFALPEIVDYSAKGVLNSASRDLELLRRITTIQEEKQGFSDVSFESILEYRAILSTNYHEALSGVF